MINEVKYFKNLIEKLGKNFDVQKDFLFSNYSYDLKASLNIRSEKFLLVPELKLFAFENHEIFLIRKEPALSVERIKKEMADLKSNIKDLAPPHKEHMSTVVTLVFISRERISSETEKFIRKFFYQKGYALGFKGWADLSAMVITLPDGRVISNKKIQKTAAFFTPDATVLQEDLS